MFVTGLGVPVRDDADSIPGVVRFFADDPFGNRIEFLASASEQALNAGTRTS